MPKVLEMKKLPESTLSAMVDPFSKPEHLISKPRSGSEPPIPITESPEESPAGKIPEGPFNSTLRKIVEG